MALCMMAKGMVVVPIIGMMAVFTWEIGLVENEVEKVYLWMAMGIYIWDNS